MTQLLTLTATFAVEEENTPQFQQILPAIEDRLRQLDGAFDCAADVASSTRRYALVVEVEGEEMDGRDAADELDEILREEIRSFAEEPWCDEPLMDEVG